MFILAITLKRYWDFGHPVFFQPVQCALNASTEYEALNHKLIINLTQPG